MPEQTLVKRDGFHIPVSITGVLAQTATNYGVVFIARFPCEVSWVSESHAVAGSDGGAVTLNIESLKSGVATGAGDDILVTAFDLKSTADTPVRYSGRDLVISKARQLKEGDRLGLVVSGTLTALQDMNITIYLKPLGNGEYR